MTWQIAEANKLEVHVIDTTNPQYAWLVGVTDAQLVYKIYGDPFYISAHAHWTGEYQAYLRLCKAADQPPLDFPLWRVVVGYPRRLAELKVARDALSGWTREERLSAFCAEKNTAERLWDGILNLEHSARGRSVSMMPHAERRYRLAAKYIADAVGELCNKAASLYPHLADCRQLARVRRLIADMEWWAAAADAMHYYGCGPMAGL
jgi:hypothetical protein